MSTEDDEPFCKATDYFYEKMNQGYNKYINSRKMKLKKRIQQKKQLNIQIVLIQLLIIKNI